MKGGVAKPGGYVLRVLSSLDVNTTFPGKTHTPAPSRLIGSSETTVSGLPEDGDGLGLVIRCGLAWEVEFRIEVGRVGAAEDWAMAC